MPIEALRTLSPTSGRNYALLDTNLLILEVSARVGPHVLSSFRRISTDFTAKDVRLLLAILSRFKAARTTAYVLAEASNLASGLTGSLRNAWSGELAQFALTTEEAHVSTKVIGSQAELPRFGVADTALAYLSQEHTVVSSDGRLCSYLERLGRKVINFNHLRPLWMNDNA